MSYLLTCSIMQIIKQINGLKWDALLQKWNLMLYSQMQLMRVKKALTLLTVSDSLVTSEETTAEEREKTFTAMMEVALEIA